MPSNDLNDGQVPNKKSDKNMLKRGNWANKTEFILSCMGYAIGIGNVWRFPYLCYRNGGGAFLIPYLLMLFFCGIPLFFMETTLGQFSNIGCVSVFRICPLFKGAGYAIVIVNLICCTYYNIILAYPLAFLYNSFQSKLPWTDCDNEWNTDKCFSLDRLHPNNSIINNSTSVIIGQTKTPADEFFHNKILQISSGIEHPGGIVTPLLICNIISWVIMYLCIMNGVRSVGKVVYFTATFPFVILFILLVRGLTLPGAWTGIKYYIYPQWEYLTNLKTWSDASQQIFFSLGPGWGGIINMASYNNFRNNNKWDSILVPLANSGTSIFAGFVVFSVLGYMSHQTGLPVSSVATAGPGLAFITYPEAVSMLPLPHLWAILFFIMLYLLGMDSLFVQMEAIISSVLDECPSLRTRKKLIHFITCFVLFLGSLLCITNGGMYVLQLLDWYCASISVILVCLVEVLIVGWTYGVDNFVNDLEFMIEEKIGWWWRICWKYSTPCILTFIFVTSIVYNIPVTYNNVVYPDWAIFLGWMSCLVSLLWIPGYAYYKLAITPGSCVKKFKKTLKASEMWGPASSEQRKLWLEQRKTNDSLIKLENMS